MSEKKRSRSDKEIVEAFDQLFDQIPSAETVEDARRNLSVAGFDPDKLVENGINRIRASLEKQTSYWRIRNQEAIKKERAKLQAIEVPPGLDAEDLRKYIELLIKRLSGISPKLVPLQLQRSGSELSEEDLSKYLQELLFAAQKAGADINPEETK